MKKRPSVALLSAGKLTDSPVTRFWGLADQLGPVKAPSLRLASRVVNTLRAGYAVETFEPFADCRLILLDVPDSSVPAAAAELSRSGIAWHNKAVVLCSTWLDVSALQPLAALGAAAGSVAPLPGFDNRLYLIEGNTRLVHETRRLLKGRGARFLTIEPPLKPFFLGALNCAGPLFYSLLVAASECLRQAAIPQAAGKAILEKQLAKTLRTYLVAGRNASWEMRGLGPQVQALEMVQPAAADYLRGMAKLSTHLLAKTGRAAAAGSSSTP